MKFNKTELPFSIIIIVSSLLYTEAKPQSFQIEPKVNLLTVLSNESTDGYPWIDQMVYFRTVIYGVKINYNNSDFPFGVSYQLSLTPKFTVEEIPSIGEIKSSQIILNEISVFKQFEASDYFSYKCGVLFGYMNSYFERKLKSGNYSESISKITVGLNVEGILKINSTCCLTFGIDGRINQPNHNVYTDYDTILNGGLDIFTSRSQTLYSVFQPYLGFSIQI